MTAKRDLQKQGFKPVPGFEGLYIDRNGAMYDYIRQRAIMPENPARFIFRKKLLSVPKLVMLIFGKQPYQIRRHVQYIDGNKSNLRLCNLRYTPDKPDIKIDPAGLMTAVRCYFAVPERYKVNDRPQTQYYLSVISYKRGFIHFHKGMLGIQVFETYINHLCISKKRVAEMHGITITQCTEIINPLIKHLIAEVLRDLEYGTLAVRDYQPRPKTNAQAIKEYNETLREYGIEPIKIPRKKSKKQILKEWDTYIEALSSGLHTGTPHTVK